jgi:hypothetical protein
MKHCLFLIVTLFTSNSAFSQINSIWLTHKSSDPSHIVVNWKSETKGNSKVYYGTTSSYESSVIKEDNSFIHHVEILLEKRDVLYHFMVKTNQEKSTDHTFKSYPSESGELRIAVVGNWGYSENVDLKNLVKDDPHLLVSCGDNIANLHALCGQGTKDCIEPYLNLIASEPELFAHIPFMPILGNHDKEIRDRGEKYPLIATYDINATAFRSFFELPDEEWKWRFRIPEFNVSLFALDIQHITDYGTTWQTCHDFHKGSEQYEWYKKQTEETIDDFIITFHNAKNDRIRMPENGSWHDLFKKGTAVITGYGYFMEKAEVDGFPYFNSSLKVGDIYADEFYKKLEVKPGYILMTFRKNNPLEIVIKSLDGQILDKSIWN